MILKLSWNTKMIYKTLMKILKNTIQIKKKQRNKVLIAFDDTITDIISNKKLNPRVTEPFIRGRKINILVAFIIQSYFKEPKEAR